MKKKIKTGVIGFGLSGKAFHAPFLHVNPGFEIIKVVERHKAESKEIYPYVDVVKELQRSFIRSRNRIGRAFVHQIVLHYPIVKGKPGGWKACDN